MLQFKNGRFYYGRVSFAIPDGWFIDTDMEMSYETSICLLNPSKTVRFELETIREKQNTKEGIEILFNSSAGFSSLSEIKPLSHNGLLGHFVHYTAGPNQYFEVHFALEDREKLLCLMYGQLDITHYIESEEFRNFFDELKTD